MRVMGEDGGNRPGEEALGGLGPAVVDVGTGGALLVGTIGS